MYNKTFVCVITSLLLLSGGSLFAQDMLGPGWHEVKITPRPLRSLNQGSDEETLQIAFEAPMFQTAVEEVPDGAGSGGGGEGGGEMVLSAEEITPPIKELARSLENDPEKIYDYVRNHIDYVPYGGSLKGATRTLLDGEGNDLDQCSLLIALLRASGNHSGKYLRGYICSKDGVNNYQSYIASWIGVENDIARIQDALSAGGISHLYREPYGLEIEHFCVEVTIDGNVRTFDPSFKRYTWTEGVGDALFNNMGYDSDEFLEAALNGSETSDYYVRKLNETNIKNKLIEYTTSLVADIRSRYPNAGAEIILGKRSIISETTRRYHWLPEAISVATIPEEYKHSLTVKHGAINQTYCTADIAHKRLTLVYTNSPSGVSYAQLWLDDEAGPLDDSEAHTLELRINHPYFDADNVKTCKLTRVNNENHYYDISYLGGNEGNGKYLEWRQKRVDDYQNAGLENNSREIISECLHLMGRTWVRELDLVKNVLQSMTGIVRIRHHVMGVASQESGVYVDMNGYSTSYFKHTGQDDELGDFRMDGIHGSALEYCVIEQLQGRDEPGISTVKVLQLANANDEKIYMANSANWTIVTNNLSEWGKYFDLKGTMIDKGYSLIISENPKAANWHGFGYMGVKPISIMMAIGPYPSTMAKGGYGTSSKNIIDNYGSSSKDLSAEWLATYWNKSEYNANTQNPKSWDPVDMGSGGFLVDHVDMSIGNPGPWGLQYERNYSSRNVGNQGPFGYGWTHSYDVQRFTNNAVATVLGLRGILDMVPILVASYVGMDVVSAENPSLAEWLTSVLVSKWATDQLVENAIVIKEGKYIREYVKLPNGEFISPPSDTSKLLFDNANNLILRERNGKQLAFLGNTVKWFNEWVDVTSYNTAPCVTLTYSSGKPYRVNDAYGRQFGFSYNGDLLTSVIDYSLYPYRTITYQYDSDNNLTNYIDPEGSHWGYTYDSDHHITTLVNPMGDVTISNEYSIDGKVVVQHSPEGDPWKFYYTDYFTIEEDPEGGRKTYHYDDNRRWCGEKNALGHSVWREYDGQGNVIKEIDARGNPTTYEYDNAGNVTNIINAYGYHTQFVYDDQNRLVMQVDAMGNITTNAYEGDSRRVKSVHKSYNGSWITQNQYTYDADGRLASETDRRGFTLNYDYSLYNYAMTKTVSWVRDGITETIVSKENNRGDIISVSDANNHTTTNAYNKRRQLISTTDALGHTASKTYYLTGQLKEEFDRNTNRTCYTYTPSDNIETITYADGSIVSNRYDSRYNLVSKIDPMRHETTYEYDKAGRMIKTVDPLGRIVKKGYDGNGNVTSVTDARGKTTRMIYDKLNQVTMVRNALTDVAETRYDKVGNVIWQKDFAGNISEFFYNDLYQLAYKKIAGSILERFFYHAVDYLGQSHCVGFLTASQDALGNWTKYYYDVLGQITNTVDPMLYHTSKSYDGAGNVLIERDANGYDVEYIYDKANRLTSVIHHGNPGLDDDVAETYVYDNVGNIVSRTDAENHAVSMDYDKRNRLIKTTDALGNTTRITYNVLGNIVEQIDALGRITRYEYDACSQCTNIIYPDGAEESFTYDNNGNQTLAVDPLGHRVKNDYDALNRVVRTFVYMDDGRVLESEVDYDKVGNVVLKTDADGYPVRYDYDAQGRMTNTVYRESENADEEISISYEYDKTGNKIDVIDAEGQRTEYDYDKNGRLKETRIETEQCGLLNNLVTYDGAGNIIKTTDAAGHVIRYEYDPMGRLTNTIYREGAERIVESIEYDKVGNTVATVDARDKRTVYHYDAAGQLTNTINALGYSTVLDYDKVGNAVRQKDAAGHVISSIYDKRNRPVQILYPDGTVEYFSYDKTGNQITAVDAAGHRVETDYDVLGRPVKMRRYRDDGSFAENTIAYDRLGNTVQTVDAEGNVTHYYYDELSRLTSVVYRAGSDRIAESFEYDRNGNKISAMDVNGTRVEYEYDELNRIIQTSTEVNGETLTSEVTYDKAGNVISQQDPAGRIISFYYDDQNRLTNMVSRSKIDGSILVSESYEFDKNGNQIAVVDGKGNRVESDYDALNRPVKTTQYIDDSEPVVTSVDYDALGNIVKQTDGKGNATRYVYDALNRLVSTVSADGTEEQYEYDALGQMKTFINGRNYSTTFDYDDFGNRTLVRDANNHEKTFSYDDDGNVIKRVDAEGDVTLYEYDDQNRLVMIDYPGTDQDVTYTYYADGSLKTVDDSLGTTLFEYDEAGQMTKAVDPFGNEVGYEYDKAGNRTKIIYPGDKEVAYAYDDANRLVSVTDWGSRTTTYHYDEAGNLSGITYPNGVDAVYSYDSRNHLVGMTYGKDGDLFIQREIDRDERGDKVLECIQDGERQVTSNQ